MVEVGFLCQLVSWRMLLAEMLHHDLITLPEPIKSRSPLQRFGFIKMHLNIFFKVRKGSRLSSLAVQWLVICPSTAEGLGPISGWKLIPANLMPCSHKKKRKEKKRKRLYKCAFIIIKERKSHYFYVLGCLPKSW